MTGACALDSVQLLCGSDVYNHGIFLNGRVYACHTTVTELDSVYEENYAGNTPVVAMSHDTLYLRWQNGVWQGFGFDSPFDYNGMDNLILEFRWQGDNDSSVYDLGYYTSGNRAMDAKSSTAERGTPRNYMPRFRIFYSQTGVAEGPIELAPGAPEVSAVPNPFQLGATLYPFSNGRYTAAVYSTSGELVRRLTGAALRWDGRDEAGRQVQPGTYFCRVRSGKRVQTVHLVRRD